MYTCKKSDSEVIDRNKNRNRVMGTEKAPTTSLVFQESVL